MNKRDLHPELRQAYRFVPSLPIHRPWVHGLVSLLQRLLPRKIKPAPGVAIEDRPLSQGAVRVYRPEQGGSGAGLLWIHGGGYIMGDVAINDRECSALARELGLVVVSVEYRLAPRYPFPAALDDCYEAWQWLLDAAADLSVDPERLAIAGQSAGGGLAAALVQRIADAGGVQPVAQVLMYPMLDDRTAANRELDGTGHVLWTNRNNRGAWEWYLGQPPGRDIAPPYAVPARREDLSGLPPAWIGVGKLDLFYREDCAYAERLQVAGVPCDLHITPRAPHGYDLLAPDAPVSRAFIHDYYRFLSERLEAGMGANQAR